MSDHVHILISIPPKYSVAEVIGYLKGKSSIWIAQNVERKLRNFLSHKFWARGYFVSTVGRDGETIRAYIRNQEMADKQLDQLQLKLTWRWKSSRELVTASEANRRASDRETGVKEAGSEAAGRRTGTG